MARTIIAATIGYTDENGAAQTLYVSTEGFVSTPADTPASTLFEGRLVGDIRYSARVASPFTSRRPVAGVGSLAISNYDGFFDNAVRWIFRDGAVTIKMFTLGGTFSGGTTITVSLVERAEFDGLGNLRLVIRDSASILSRALQQDTFTLAEAPDAEGELKPYGMGGPFSVSPVMIDDSNSAAIAYQTHESNDAGVLDVYQDGTRIAHTPTLNGFTLPTAPTGRITADIFVKAPPVTGLATTQSIQTGIVADGGILDAGTILRVNAAPITSPENWELTGAGVQSRNAASGGKYYFEMKVSQAAPENDTTYFDAPFGWDVAVGIGDSIPSNPSHPVNANQYCALIRRDSATTWKLYHYDDTSLTDTVNNPGGYNTPVPRNVGVKVDFDNMQIGFRFDGVDVGTVGTITANSPPGTFWPLVGCAFNSSSDPTEVHNTLQLKLSPGSFSSGIPSGYTAWSPDPVVDFSDLVTSITDKISGLTVDTTSQTTIDNIGYTYSYFINDTKTAADILFEACISHSGWYYINRVGSLAFGRLEAPAASGVITFTDAEIIDIVGINKDYAPGLSNRMGALRNWTVLTPGSVSTTETEARKAELTRPFQFEAVNTTALASTYNHATGAAILPTYFRAEEDATAEIARIVALYATERKFLTVDAAFNLAQFASFNLGDTIEIDFNRLLLESNPKAYSSAFSSGFGGTRHTNEFLLLGFEANLTGNKIRLELWG